LLVALTGLGLGLAGVQLWAWQQYHAARRALERYRLAEARQHLEHCLRVWPSDFDVRLLAAQTARRMGDFQEAEEHLARCREVRGGPTDEVVLEQTLIRAQRGGMDSVTPYLRSLVEQGHAATPLIFEALVHGYMKSYRLGDAAALLNAWRERWPDDIQANYLQGFVREQTGPQQEAVDNYRRVLEHDPEHDEARLRLATLLIDQAEPAQALEQLDQLVRRRPEDPTVLTSLAECQLALGRLQEAEQNLDRVLAEHPQFRSALAYKGEVALKLDRPAEAERWLRKALALDAPDFRSNFALARSLRQQGKDAEAADVEKRLKVLEADLHRIRKIVSQDMNKSPYDPKLRTEVGTILLRAGSTREGVQWLYSALRQNPAYAPAHRALAEHFERIGQADRAAPHRRFLSGGAEPDQPPG
jgi:predicted Zn-dependent protease